MFGKLCQRQTQRTKYHVESVTVIIDLKGLRLAQARKNFQKLQPRLGDKALDKWHYPERVGTIFVINAPLYFSALWTMVRPFVPERTAAKMRTLRGNFQEELKAVVDSSVLPPCYGGTGQVIGEHSDVLEVFGQ
jgi:hypothetical protein